MNKTKIVKLVICLAMTAGLVFGVPAVNNTGSLMDGYELAYFDDVFINI